MAGAAMRAAHVRRAAQITAVLTVLSLVGCGTGTAPAPTSSSPTDVSSPTSTLPGAGNPPVTIGDKNFTEQFILGELYAQALTAEGYSVALNQNIGPTEVTVQALQSGRLDMYPEYLGIWNSTIAGYRQRFASDRSAYRAAQRFALGHGFELLGRTPFSDTDAVGVSFNYSAQNGLSSIGDLREVASSLTFGGPPQFAQNADGLPAIELAYDVRPAMYKPLGVGGQYQALDQGLVQAADVHTTDGQLISGNYTLLADPRHVFGWGNAVPVVPLKVIQAEGPAFATTINRVTSLLSTSAIRQLNAAVDVSGEDPKMVAEQFLTAHGLLAPPPG